MKILTLDDASGYGGQQYYVDDEGKFAGLVPANQPTTPANKAPTFSTPGSADYNPYTNPNATEEEKIQFRQNNFPYSPANPTYIDNNIVGGDPTYDDHLQWRDVGLSPPTQTMDDLTSALSAAQDLNLDPAQRFKNRTSDLTGVKYGDKKAFEYDLGDAYDNIVAVRSGDSLKFFQDGERLDRDQASNALGIDVLSLNSLDSGNQKISSLFNQLRDQETQKVYDQFGGVEGDLVSQYLKDQAAAEIARKKKDERSDERDAKRFENLRNQVAKEATDLFPDLTYSDAIDRYYELPFSQRASMAVADLGEVFDSSQGELFQNPNAIDPNNPRNLGVLGSESLATAQQKAENYFNEPVEAFFNIPDVSGAVDDPNYGKGVYTPPDDDETGSTYDDLGGALLNLPADALNFEKSGFTIPGTNITITAPEGDMSSGGGGSGDRYGTRPKFGAFANISGGGGGGIWDRFRSSYLTKYGLEGESPDIDEIKVRYDPESGVYFYPDGTPIDPADLEGLDISDTFQEQTGTERFKL
jgi:hypothetical protein